MAAILTGPARHQPPNHTLTPCTMPTGKNVAEAIRSGRQPFDAQNTMEVSQAEYIAKVRQKENRDRHRGPCPLARAVFRAGA